MTLTAKFFHQALVMKVSKNVEIISDQIRSDQSLSRVRLFTYNKKVVGAIKMESVDPEGTHYP